MRRTCSRIRRASAASGASAVAASATTVGWARSSADIDLSSSLDGVEPPQPDAPVGGALTGLDVVLPAVPGTDDVDLAGREAVADMPLLLVEHGLDLADQHALADRAAHVAADVLEGEVPAVPLEDEDLARADRDHHP